MNISVDDLNSLKNDMNLNENIINYYIKLLCNCDIRKFYIFHSSLLDTYENNGIESVIENLVEITNMKEKKLFFLPIYYKNQWRLLTFDVDSMFIKYYDSNKNTCAQIEKWAIDFAILFSRICKVTITSNCWRIAKDKEFLNWKLSFKQRDNVDSGIFVLLFARQIIYNKPYNFNTFTVHDFRRKAYDEIVAGKIDTSYQFITE
jgi:Ulp1 family protease